MSAGPDQVIPAIGILGASVALLLLFWGTISRRARGATVEVTRSR